MDELATNTRVRSTYLGQADQIGTVVTANGEYRVVAWDNGKTYREWVRHLAAA